MPEKKLIVIGDGPDMKKIKSYAASNISILGYQPRDVLTDHMKRAKAFVFAAEEDFGIIPVEAQSYGTPVIAYKKGGALETVIEGKTGIFFDEQTEVSIIDAVNRFESSDHDFDPAEIRAHSEQFSIDRFKEEFIAFIEKIIAEKQL